MNRRFLWCFLAFLVSSFLAQGIAPCQHLPKPDQSATIVDIGAEGDEKAIVSGFHEREGPYPKAKWVFPRNCTFRWVGNEFAMKLPAYPQRRNAITFRLAAGDQILRFSCGEWSAKVYVTGRQDNEYTLIVPAEIIGNLSELTLQCNTLTPVKPNPKQADARVLMAMIDWVRVRPATESDTMPELKPIAKLDPSVPVTRRLRGVEARPSTGDIAAYMMPMVDGGVTVATIGVMNGHIKTNYPSKYAVHASNIDPNWIPMQIKALHEAGIKAISWVCFNVQDLRNVEDYQPIKQFPQWAMKFIPGGVEKARPRVGMCVVSSPYRDHHAKLVAEAAAFDLDGMFFDGFYLGGIPHPTAPGCVCDFCAKKFTDETGLDLPEKVDWTEMRFKRWVRWRNEKIIETACYFRDAIHKVKPGLPLTMNTNQWPFGNKDWDTAIPLWRMTDFGVSQHAYSLKPELEWLMLGYKCRLTRDMNPDHCDVWRPAGANYSRGDLARHEAEMRLFMLAALSYGAVPWHGGHIPPLDAENRVHHMVAEREPYFARDEIRHVGVWVSQNTHDFWGHLPETSNLIDYRDTVLGNWLLLTERHVPFHFVFDNMVDAGRLDEFKIILAPNVIAMSEEAAAQIAKWVENGGRLIVTGDVSSHDEWGVKLGKPRLADLIAGGKARHLSQDPGLAYVRNRDVEAVKALMSELRATPLPIEFDAPPSIVANTFYGPARKSLYIHLLNVSMYMPNDDTGFRGLEQPPKFVADTASDAQIEGSNKAVEGKHRIIKNIVVRPKAWKVKLAVLAIAGQEIEIKDDGSIVVPQIDVHDVLLLTLAD
ncbi:MAG: beta-galactosidase trimerization domain-containing protein [Planctomycetota bacterium]